MDSLYLPILFLYLFQMHLFATTENICILLLDEQPNVSIPLQKRLTDGVRLIDENKINVGAGDEAIFIMGLPGSGKTSVTLLLNGDYNHIYAARGNDRTSFYIDGAGRIGRPNGNSKTLIPEFFVTVDTQTTLVDCPAFHAGVGTDDEIATMYHLKYALGLVKRAKFVFTITYTSISDVDFSDLDALVTQAVSLFSNVKNLKQAIGIVVTKTPREIFNGGEITVDMLFADLKGIFEAYNNKLTGLLQLAYTKKESNLLSKKIDFVRNIISDEGYDGLLLRISYVLTPEEDDCISLEKVPEIRETQNALADLCYNQMKYICVTPDDFETQLTLDAKHAIEKTHIYVWFDMLQANLNIIIDKANQNLRDKLCSFVETSLLKLPNLEDRFFDKRSVSLYENDFEIPPVLLADPETEAMQNWNFLNYGMDSEETLNQNGKQQDLDSQEYESLLWNPKITQTSDEFQLNKDHTKRALRQKYNEYQVTLRPKYLMHSSEISVDVNEDGSTLEIVNSQQVNQSALQDAINFLTDTTASTNRHINKIRDSVKNWGIELFEMCTDINVEFSKKSCLISRINELVAQLEYFQTVTGKEYSFIKSKYLQLLTDFRSEIQDWKLFFEYCQTLEVDLGKWNSQVYLEKLALEEDQKLLQRSMLNYFDITKYNFNSMLNILFANNRPSKQMVLNTIFKSETPNVKMDCEISSKDNNMRRLKLSGRNVKFSNLRKSWPNGCEEEKVDQVVIFARETLFLDVDIQFKCKGINLYLIAPEWEAVKNINPITIELGCRENAGQRIYSYTLHSLYGSSGANGGNGSSFFGMRRYDVNIRNGLKIQSNGGHGKPGADGGDGRDGKDGEEPEFIEKFFPKKCKFDHAEYWKYCNPAKKGKVIKTDGTILRQKYWFHHLGGEGESGGDADPGETGGAPGIPGNITIIGGSESVIFTSTPGNPGPGGSAGTPGKKGKNGRHLSCPQERYRVTSGGVHVKYKFRWHHKSKCFYTKNTMNNNKDGESANGGNTISISSEIKMPLGVEPWELINDYKATFRHQSTKHNFNHLLDFHADFVRLQTPLSFAKDLVKLETEYYTEANSAKDDYGLWREQQPKYLVIYENFLEKIKLYEKNSGKTLSLEDRRALTHIYLAVLSKMVALRQNLLNVYKVTNTHQYFQSIQTKMEDLKNALKEAKREQEISKIRATIDKEKDRFNAILQDKINEASYHIENTALPSLAKTQTTIQELSVQLKAELEALLKQAQANLDKLKHDLKVKLPLKAFFELLNVAGNAVSLLGAKGLVIASIINQVSSVGNSMVEGSGKPLEQNFGLHSNISKTFRKHNRNYYRERISTISQQLELTWETIKKEGKRKTDNINKLRNKANLLQVSWKALQISTNKWRESPEILSKKLFDTETALQNTWDEVKILANNQGMRASNGNTNWQTLEKVFKFGNVAGGFVGVIANGINDWNKAEELIKGAEQAVTNIKAKIAAINTDFVPLLMESMEAIQKAGKNMEGHSLVGISVKEWNLQNMVQTMRDVIKDFSEGLGVAEDYEVCINGLDRSLHLLINLYNHIQRYEETKSMADYIANIAKAGHISQFDTPGLGEAITRVTFLTQANIFLHDYQMAMTAFRQWIFPFPKMYLTKSEEKLDIVSLMQNVASPWLKPETINIMVTYYMNKVKRLTSDLARYNSTIIRGEDSLVVEDFIGGNTTSSSPFYTWVNDQWYNQIRDFLYGKTIELNADIDDPSLTWMDGIGAVKFKCVRLKLRANNKTLQGTLDALLSHFHVRMIHSGTSVYRALTKKYVMHDNKMPYRYGYELISGEPISSSVVKEKVCNNGDHLMSPYTWWTFQLLRARTVNVTTALVVSDKLFEIFKDPGSLSLDLEGTGMYLDERYAEESILNDLGLDDFYEAYGKDTKQMYKKCSFRSCRKDDFSSVNSRQSGWLITS